MKYKFTCGCTYAIKQIKYRQRNRRGPILCPIHNKRIECVVFTCAICGKIEESRGAQKRYCAACKEKNKNTAYIPNIGTELGKPQPIRKTNCIYYLPKCMSFPDGILYKKPNACIGCKKYKPMNLNDEILNYASAGADSFTPVSW